MPDVVVRLCWSTLVCALLPVALIGCGQYEPPSEPRYRESPHYLPESRVGPGSTWRENLFITPCADVPLLPKDPADISVSRSTDDGVGKVLNVTLFWNEETRRKSPELPELSEYVVRIDDPTCAKRPDIRAWFKIRADPPRFENARIVVRPGQKRAYVGYTVVGGGENQYASPSDIRAVGSDGRRLDWKHQTATGGPADVVAMDEPMTIEPATEVGGDADYFDASTVKAGETVRVTFKFETGPVEVPFRVVAAD